ncbi:unnamed protein product [Dicrocoelium dendriticum]|nr:unnamed protein product [Dicrocoelium dendriticum]
MGNCTCRTQSTNKINENIILPSTIPEEIPDARGDCARSVGTLTEVIKKAKGTQCQILQPKKVNRISCFPTRFCHCICAIPMCRATPQMCQQKELETSCCKLSTHNALPLLTVQEHKKCELCLTDCSSVGHNKNESGLQCECFEYEPYLSTKQSLQTRQDSYRCNHIASASAPGDYSNNKDNSHPNFAIKVAKVFPQTSNDQLTAHLPRQDEPSLMPRVTSFPKTDTAYGLIVNPRSRSAPNLHFVCTSDEIPTRGHLEYTWSRDPSVAAKGASLTRSNSCSALVDEKTPNYWCPAQVKSARLQRNRYTHSPVSRSYSPLVKQLETIDEFFPFHPRCHATHPRKIRRSSPKNVLQRNHFPGSTPSQLTYNGSVPFKCLNAVFHSFHTIPTTGSIADNFHPTCLAERNQPTIEADVFNHENCYCFYGSQPSFPCSGNRCSAHSQPLLGHCWHDPSWTYYQNFAQIPPSSQSCVGYCPYYLKLRHQSSHNARKTKQPGEFNATKWSPAKYRSVKPDCRRSRSISQTNTRQCLAKPETKLAGEKTLYSSHPSDSCKHRFYLKDSYGIDRVLADPCDRRIRAICDRFQCDLEVYSKIPKSGYMQYVIDISSPSLWALHCCARALDSSLNWCLSPQLAQTPVSSTLSKSP